MSFVEDLQARDLVYQSSHPHLAEECRKGPMSLYCGFDPTAASLHVGSLLPILTLVRAQRAGHRPIAVVGGATGLIGDPSGKSEERKLLSPEDLAVNVAGLQKELSRFLDFSPGAARLVNNADWFSGLGYIEFLRKIGKLFSVNMMLGKESVRARLEDRDQGISYTEFSYMLIQAYDYLWLYENHNCRLQIGGSDQWGNIVAGTDLIRRVHQAEVFALTMPLITTASGQKFGKTEKGAVWLSAERTSPYEFYQFFMQTEDRDVGRFLKFYTFLSNADIVALEETVARAPEKREAQRVLAREVTTIVHGPDEAARAEATAVAFFTKGIAALDGEARKAALGQAPSSQKARAALPLSLVELLAETGLASSRGSARRDIAGGGVYLNDVRVDDVERQIAVSDLVDGNHLVLRKGKKNYHVVNIVD